MAGLYKNRLGVLDVTLFDPEYNIIYKNKAHLKNKQEVREMFQDLEAKGFNLFDYKEASWF